MVLQGLVPYGSHAEWSVSICFLASIQSSATEPEPVPCRTFDFAKNFWALRFGELGYTSLYLDTDVIVLKDPFKHYQASYDIQVRTRLWLLPPSFNWPSPLVP
mgnify:CR=1 FL=1